MAVHLSAGLVSGRTMPVEPMPVEPVAGCEAEAALAQRPEPERAEPERQPVRRRRAPGGRHRVVFVRVSDAEHDELSALARRAGLSIPRLLVEAACAGSAGDAAHRRVLAYELLRAAAVATGVANNVNQMAKWANTNHGAPHALADVVVSIRRTHDELLGIARELAPSAELGR